MKENIKIEFGIDKNGNYLFYVSVGSDKEFWINKKDAEEELNYELIKSALEPTKQGIIYIQEMYKRWYEEYGKN